MGTATWIIAAYEKYSLFQAKFSNNIVPSNH